MPRLINCVRLRDTFVFVDGRAVPFIPHLDCSKSTILGTVFAVPPVVVYAPAFALVLQELGVVPQ